MGWGPRSTAAGRIPERSCTFLSDAGERLHRSGVQPIDPIEAGATAPCEFQLGTRVSEATRYELAAVWTEE